MADHSWPLRRPIPREFVFFTKADLLEALSDADDDAPIWIDNYWQPVRQIAQRPLELIAAGPDGIHLG